jgi:hypothetical protein
LKSLLLISVISYLGTTVYLGFTLIELQETVRAQSDTIVDLNNQVSELNSKISVLSQPNNIIPQPFEFSISVNPNSGSVQQGSNITQTVTVSLTSGSPQSVDLSTSGLPSDTSALFNQSSGTPTFSTMMTISTSSKTAVGTYIITLIASGEDLTKITTYTLTVTSPLNVHNDSIPTWNVAEIGTIMGQRSFMGAVIFNNNLVFWRDINSTNFAVTALDLTNYTFRDVFNFTHPAFSLWYPTAMKIINNTVFAAYGYVGYPVYNATIIESSNLRTWTQYCVSNSLYIESIEQYTGPGPFHDTIEYGGYRSDGSGTYACIRTWNSTSSSEISLFNGTIWGSDDACYMTMFNSTCMIAGDAFPYHILYTNDGQNWTDPDVEEYSSQYPFDWGWSLEIRNGSAYTTAEPYDESIDHGGLVKWNNTFTPFDYGKSMESIANGLIGGCEGLYNTGLTDYPGVACVYQYNLDGTLGSSVWHSTYHGAVFSLVYDPGKAAWYGLVISNNNQNISVIKITQ